jgi:hypothetical protein
MRTRSLALIGVLLAAGLTGAMGSSPALALAAIATVVLTAWALVTFLRWREGLRPGPDAEPAVSPARRRARDARSGACEWTRSFTNPKAKGKDIV